MLSDKQNIRWKRSSCTFYECLHGVAVGGMLATFGAWRSPVARLHGVQEAPGSNPGAPTGLDNHHPPMGSSVQAAGDFVRLTRKRPSGE